MMTFLHCNWSAMSQQPQFDSQKFKEAVHYVCATCPPNRLGSVKLHKSLYFADMIAYATRGTPITGAAYRRQPLGPMAQKLLPTLRELRSEGAVDISEVEYFGYRKAEFRSLKPYRPVRLSDEDRALIDEVVEFVCNNHSARTISDFSHTLAWQSVESGDIMPYQSSILLFPSEEDEEDIAWAEGEARRFEEGAIKPLAPERDGRFRAHLREARRSQSITARDRT
jgi:Protein of unknown function (DUF4065)